MMERRRRKKKKRLNREYRLFRSTGSRVQPPAVVHHRHCSRRYEITKNKFCLGKAPLNSTHCTYKWCWAPCRRGLFGYMQLPYNCSFPDLKKGSYTQNPICFLSSTLCQPSPATNYQTLNWVKHRPHHNFTQHQWPEQAVEANTGAIRISLRRIRPFLLWTYIKTSHFFSVLTAHNSCLVQASNKHRLLCAGTSVIVKEVFSQTMPLNKIFSPTDVMRQTFFSFFLL